MGRSEPEDKQKYGNEKMESSSRSRSKTKKHGLQIANNSILNVNIRHVLELNISVAKIGEFWWRKYSGNLFNIHSVVFSYMHAYFNDEKLTREPVIVYCEAQGTRPIDSKQKNASTVLYLFCTLCT